MPFGWSLESIFRGKNPVKIGLHHEDASSTISFQCISSEVKKAKRRYQLFYLFFLFIFYLPRLKPSIHKHNVIFQVVGVKIESDFKHSFFPLNKKCISKTNYFLRKCLPMLG